MFGPTRTTIMRAENLSAARTEVDLLWMLCIDCDAKGGAVRRHTPVKALPGLAQVSATQHTPRSTAEVLTDAGVEGIRIIRGSLHASGIGDRREFFQVQVLPGIAPVATAPDADAVGNTDHIRPRRAKRNAVQVHQVNVAVEVAVHEFPALAAIGTARGATDFERGVHTVRVGWLNRQAQDACGKGHLHSVQVDDGRQIVPGLATIIAGIDFAPFRAEKHDLRVVWMELQRPYGPSFG